MWLASIEVTWPWLDQNSIITEKSPLHTKFKSIWSFVGWVTGTPCPRTRALLPHLNFNVLKTSNLLKSSKYLMFSNKYAVKLTNNNIFELTAFVQKDDKVISILASSFYLYNIWFMSILCQILNYKRGYLKMTHFIIFVFAFKKIFMTSIILILISWENGVRYLCRHKQSQILQFLGGQLYTKLNENMSILCIFIFNYLNVFDNFMTYIITHKILFLLRFLKWGEKPCKSNQFWDIPILIWIIAKWNHHNLQDKTLSFMQ